MTRTVQQRLLAWSIILCLLLAIGWSLRTGIEQLSSYFKQTFHPEAALNIVPNVTPDLYLDLAWQADDANSGRPMEPNTRAQIQDAYTRAWLQWDFSFTKGAPYGLDTYFVGPALASASAAIQQNAQQGYQVNQVDTTHTLKLHFYSADGSIVSFTDSNVLVAYTVRDRNGTLVFVGERNETYQVVMFLEDGNWRIRYWVQSANSALHPSPLVPRTGFVTTRGTQLALNGQRYSIAGVNYYPANAPWDKFWFAYKAAQTRQDFARMRALGINTVRIFFPFDQVGGAAIEAPAPPTTNKKKATQVVQQPLEKLADLLNAAQQNHLHVIVTLFDLSPDYTLIHWAQRDNYLKTILTRFRNNPTILAWDLKNEPDLDYATSGQDLVDSWLAHTAYLARRYDPYHLLTIGWSSATAAQTSIAGLNFVSFHYYLSPDKLPQAYSALRRVVKGQPIVLSEFGMSTWNSPVWPMGHTEQEQARYYTEILQFWRTTGSPGAICWTFYDFPNFFSLPAALFGDLPWRIATEQHFGIMHSDGKPKEAAHLMTPGARLTPIASPSPWQVLLRPFWLLIPVLALIMILVAVRRTRRRMITIAKSIRR